MTSGTRQDGSRPALPLEERESHGDENKSVRRASLPAIFIELPKQRTAAGASVPTPAAASKPAPGHCSRFGSALSLATLAEPTARGFRFLEATQLPDGAWPASPESREGCWVTALACWALLGIEEFSGSVRRGLSWLCADQPGEARLWWRLLRRLHRMRRVSSQKDSYYGWSWTLGTASWVEPTSSAVIVLGSAPARSVSLAASRRMRLAEAMLYDRMCPGGGWNCGNPMVYGVPGEPQVGTTAWALLALRQHADRHENQLSMQWLEQAWPKMQSPASLAMAHLALDACGREQHDARNGVAQGARRQRNTLECRDSRLGHTRFVRKPELAPVRNR